MACWHGDPPRARDPKIVMVMVIATDFSASGHGPGSVGKIMKASPPNFSLYFMPFLGLFSLILISNLDRFSSFSGHTQVLRKGFILRFWKSNLVYNPNLSLSPRFQFQHPLHPTSPRGSLSQSGICRRAGKTVASLLSACPSPSLLAAAVSGLSKVRCRSRG